MITSMHNELLKRHEVTAVLAADANPGMEACMEQLAAHFKVDKDVIALKQVHSKFGSSEFLVHAYVYASKEAKQLIEPKPKVKKAAPA